jgi:hypothetical protein
MSLPRNKKFKENQDISSENASFTFRLKLRPFNNDNSALLYFLLIFSGSHKPSHNHLKLLFEQESHESVKWPRREGGGGSKDM